MIIRPRLTDHYNIQMSQAKSDFAIPYLDEDIPFFVDPFLLWKSPSQNDQSLHLLMSQTITKICFNKDFSLDDKVEMIIYMSECDEAGLGSSKTRKGRRISRTLAVKIIETITAIDSIKNSGLRHLEILQLLIEGVGPDILCDFALNSIKSYLIDYTISQSNRFSIPLSEATISYIDTSRLIIVKSRINLPVNPINNQAILLVPKRWLRKNSFINYKDYSKDYIPTLNDLNRFDQRADLITYSRFNYDLVLDYINLKERSREQCNSDPLFNQIPLLSAKRKYSSIKKLPTGKINNADMKYEQNVCPLLTSAFYPQLDFAAVQSRTDSGSHIRDLIFYNTNYSEFLEEIYNKYDARQIVFELKNVEKLNTSHVNQLNRYLSGEIGRFGVLFTRNPPPRNVQRNIIELWSGQRKAILVMTDEDLGMISSTYDSKQRDPIDVLKRSYLSFQRLLPT